MTFSPPLESNQGWKGSRNHEQQSIPNILLLVTDQFRYDALSPTVTPNLYHLATNTSSDGRLRTTQFVNAYSSTPTCTPARAALLTGKSPWNHGMLGYFKAVDCEEYATTLPSVLKDLLGYDTVVVGKNHFGTKPTNSTTTESNEDNNPLERRFVDHGYQFMELYDGLTEIPDDYDEFFHKMLPGEDPLATCHLGWNDWEACPYKFEEYLHPTSWTTREALDILDKKLGGTGNRERPLFLKVSYHRPHSPYDPPKRLWDKHQQRAKNHSNNNIEPNYTRNIGSDPSSWDREYCTKDVQDAAWHGDPGNEASLRSRAAYLANAEFVDEGIGQILERLKQHGQEDNTFVVWLSDHGDMNGDHNLWRKGYPWEASSHINLVMKLPSRLLENLPNEPKKNPNKSKTYLKRTIATVSDAVVEIRDVAPTIYDLLGILNNVTRMDPMMNGKSLFSILQRRSKSVRSHLDLEHSIVYDDRIHWNAIVGRVPNTIQNPDPNCTLYKYIFFAGYGNEQLFCLSEDPLEQHNLLNSSHYETIQSYWRTTMAQNFKNEGRGEHWVYPNGSLAIRTSGTILGPNYPCQHQLRNSSIEQDNKPAWTTVQTRNYKFVEQLSNVEKSIRGKGLFDRDVIAHHPLAHYYRSTNGLVLVVAAFGLAILLVRYFGFDKRRSSTKKKNF